MNPNFGPIRPPLSVGAIPGQAVPGMMNRPIVGGFPLAPQSAPAIVNPAQPLAAVAGVSPGQPIPVGTGAVTTSASNAHVLGAEEGGNIVDEHEDLVKQKKENDYSGEWGKRVYCKRHFNSMMPLLLIFIPIGRFPFGWKVEPNGTYHFRFKAVRFITIYFLFVTGLMTFVLLSGMYNASKITELIKTTISGEQAYADYHKQREYEEILIKRYYIPLIYVYSSLVHGWMATFLMLKKRNYIAHYYTFWSKSVYTMHMDISRYGRGFSMQVLAIVIFACTCFILLSTHKIGPTSIGLPIIFGDLTFRQLLDDYWLETNTGTRKTVQVLGGFLLIFVFIGSKSTIVAFVYHCKLLQSAFAYWNGRVYAAVLRGGEYTQTAAGRTTYKLLFKDHCILLDLMEGLDHAFAFSLESYFGCQIFSLFFELYFCIRTAKHGVNRKNAAYPESVTSAYIVVNAILGDAYFVRPFDWAPGMLMLFLSIVLIYKVAKSAASVSEEAIAGLEVIRRRTMLGRKTDDELFFMLSMFSSYTAYKKLQISGGGYSYLNKDFIIGLVSAVLSYFIILYQFQPVMDEPFSAVGEEREDRIRFGKFLANIEGLDDEHYETTPHPGDIWKTFRRNATIVRRGGY